MPKLGAEMMDDEAKLAEAYATIRFLAGQWMDYWHGEAGFGPPHRKVIKTALDAAPKPDPSPFVMVPRQKAIDKGLMVKTAENVASDEDLEAAGLTKTGDELIAEDRRRHGPWVLKTPQEQADQLKAAAEWWATNVEGQ